MVNFDSIAKEVKVLLASKFSEPDFEQFFLLEIKQAGGNKIQVFIDHDTGVTFDHCRILSRFLEAHLDEHPDMPEKYVLEVSSPGADRPISLPRQFAKHVGRTLKIQTVEGEKFKGKLVESTDVGINIEIKNKSKKTAETLSIPYEMISSAQVLITFKK